MTRQIVVIHGGDAFDTREEYRTFLSTRDISLDRFRLKRDWKETLQERLGEDYDVLAPRMPNGSDARYDEWALWFGRIAPLLYDGVALVGHSLGGIFLAKFLAENDFPRRISGLFLVAAPYERVGDFRLPASLDRLRNQVANIVLFQSEDDPVVPPSELRRYREQLPRADTVVLSDRGHFNQEDFPELLAMLKKHGY